MGINANAAAKVAGVGIDIGGKFEEMHQKQWTSTLSSGLMRLLRRQESERLEQLISTSSYQLRTGSMGMVKRQYCK